MKSFGLVSAILSTVGVVSAYTQPVNGPMGNPIGRPGLHEKVPVGKPYTITWTPNHCTDSTVTLLLLKGPSNNIIPQYPIVEKTGNSGSYVWTPDASFPDSTEGYGVQLICDSNGDYQWSTQFGFANDGAVVDTTTTEVASTTTTAAADTTTEESDYPTTTEESDYPTTTTTAEEEETTTTEESDYPTTSTTPYANTTTTVHTTTSTTTTTTSEVETTTTEIEYEEPTEEPTTLATITYTPTNSTKPPSNTSTVSIPTQSDSGVAKNVASFGVALVALAVAGFSLF